MVAKGDSAAARALMRAKALSIRAMYKGQVEMELLVDTII